MPVALPRALPPMEGFALETRSGLIFTVKGGVHPPDRTVAYLRYVPDPAGERGAGRHRYRRVYRFEEQQAVLRAQTEDYLIDDPVFGVRVQAVPTHDVACVYDPRRRLRQVEEEGPAEALEEAALTLSELLRVSAGVHPSALGLTGSLLVRLQNESSDIDIVVYDDAQCRAVHAALADLLARPAGPIRRPRAEELTAIHRAHSVDTPLSAAAFAAAQARKVNEGRFGARPYFIRFVKLPAETGERYGDPRYEPCGSATVLARVEDAADALFTPCRYVVRDAHIVAKGPARDLLSIVSFRGRFADQAREGEQVIAHGALERVVPRAAAPSYRLVVGGRPGDYLARRE